MSDAAAQFVKAGAIIELDLGACNIVPLGPVELFDAVGRQCGRGEAISYRGYGAERRYVVRTETGDLTPDIPAHRLRRLTSDRKD